MLNRVFTCISSGNSLIFAKNRPTDMENKKKLLEIAKKLEKMALAAKRVVADGYLNDVAFTEIAESCESMAEVLKQIAND